MGGMYGGERVARGVLTHPNIYSEAVYLLDWGPGLNFGLSRRETTYAT